MKLRANSSLLISLAILLPGIACAAPSSDADPRVSPLQNPPPVVVPIVIDAIFQHNLFDPKRKQWQETGPQQHLKIETSAVTEQDVQIYGIIVMGDYKRAIVKLGGQFAGITMQLSPETPGTRIITPKKKNNEQQQPARQYMILSEGQQLGSYILTNISNSGLTFSALHGTTTSIVAFNKKNDRQEIPNSAIPLPMTNFPVNPAPVFQPNPPPGAMPAFGGAPGALPAGNPIVTISDPGTPPQDFNDADNAANAYPAAYGPSGSFGSSGQPDIVVPQLPPGTGLAATIEAYRAANGGRIPSGGPNPLIEQLRARAAAGGRPPQPQ